jgi:hypothetical protein
MEPKDRRMVVKGAKSLKETQVKGKVDMGSLMKTPSALMASMILVTVSGSAWGEECASMLDKLQQTLERGDIAPEQMASLSGDLDEARQLADGGDDEGCTVAAAKLQSAMLQIDGIDHDALCDRTQSEEDIGEADMAGNQDVMAGLQTGCDDE